ncbi:uncharacterized protein N0V89_000484 [Didymosphaeria variabile]|uniref:Uncharacterized protein n=1 Tax=Didymosphaeria variabile TaxID=1932322 RepID=A0A9W8XWR4_9PLEO|nr:uncharacterized protein N0V89_000484 [Didymosphaeria variabile]KAJ4359925.1 hypothetical protein N0V89_000484 [Didymosphaeria variabile]
MISTKVTSACSKTRGQENSALEVFSKYCQLADLEKVTTTESETFEPTSSASSMQSIFASPASTPATTTASSTASPTGNPSSQTSEFPEPEGQDNTAAIAAGVVVPVVAIALGLVGFLLYLHRRTRNPHNPGELPASAENQATEVSGAPMAYEKESYRHMELDAECPQELATEYERGELGASTSEADRDRKIQRLLTNENKP